MPSIWIPVVGFLAWAGFGINGMLFLHFDNLVNAARAGVRARRTARVSTGCVLPRVRRAKCGVRGCARTR